MPTESQAKRLERIEEKIDKITDAVNELTIRSAVMENRTEDLEIRRGESYDRQNKFSEKLDHVHDCMHDVKAKVELSHKLVWAVGIAVIIGVINEVLKII